MSQKVKKLVPELRFSEFRDTWLKKSLGEVCNKIQDGNYGESYPKSDEFLETGIPFLTSKAIGKDGQLIKSKIDYISQEKHIQLNKAHLSIDDVLFTNRGANVGVIGFVDRRISNGNIGPQLTLLRSNINIILPMLLQYYMNTYAFQKQVHSQDSGSAMNFFGIGATEKLIIYISTIAEQEKIASFLGAIATRLTQLRRKRELLQTYKRGVMQKIFSQQIRFRGAIGSPFPDWQKKKLGELLTIRYGKDHKDLKDGDYPVLGTGGVMRYVDSYLYDKPSILIGRKGTIDQPQFVTYPFWTVDTLFYSKINSDVIPFFLFLVVQSINWKKYNEATGVPSLNTSSINNVKVIIPSDKKEQEKIASFLTAIDQKIEAISRQIDRSEQFKKGLLQKMFV